MEGFLGRDTRHLAGSSRTSEAPTPPARGLALDHRWDGAMPVLVVRDGAGGLRRLPLVGRLDLEVLEPTWCIGRDVGGRFVPCPFGRAADRFAQCIDCHPLPDRECVFNPRCHGCTSSFCTGPHQVYVAWYGTRPKIGMTRAARQGARLVEQGADAYAFLAEVTDRFEARRLEDLLSRRLDVPQARRPQELFTQMARAVPWQAIGSAHAALVERAEAVPGVRPGPLVRLGPWPGTWPLPEVPTRVAEVGRHRGDIVAVKGKWLVYRDGGGPLWALRMPAVETHEVLFDPAMTETSRGDDAGAAVDPEDTAET